MILEQARKKFPIGSECYYYSKYGGKMKITVFNIEYSNIEPNLSVVSVPPKNSVMYHLYDINRCFPPSYFREQKLKRILDIEK